MIILLLVFGENTHIAFVVINQIAIYLSVIFSLWSGIDYVVKGKDIILESKQEDYMAEAKDKKVLKGSYTNLENWFLNKFN